MTLENIKDCCYWFEDGERVDSHVADVKGKPNWKLNYVTKGGQIIRRSLFHKTIGGAFTF